MPDCRHHAPPAVPRHRRPPDPVRPRSGEYAQFTDADLGNPLLSRVDPGPHWKTRPIVEHAAGRPFAWVDDETTDADRSWVAEVA
ncbi:hypothetical protein [Amycolatopsis sp. NPDC004378]